MLQSRSAAQLFVTLYVILVDGSYCVVLASAACQPRPEISASSEQLPLMIHHYMTIIHDSFGVVPVLRNSPRCICDSTDIDNVADQYSSRDSCKGIRGNIIKFDVTCLNMPNFHIIATTT